MHDSDMEFDFFASTGNLRFYFVGFDHQLFLELRTRDGKWMEVSVFMLHALRSPYHDSLFNRLHACVTRGGVWPPAIRVRLIRVECHEPQGHMQLAVHFLGLNVIAAVLQIVCTAAKAQLCLPLRAAADKAGSACRAAL